MADTSTEDARRVEHGIFPSGDVADDDDVFRCWICTTDVTFRDCRAHAVSQRHAAILRRFNSVFGAKSAKGVDCRVCGKQLRWQAVRDHADWHKVVPWYEPPDRYRVLFENHVNQWNDQFYCNPCDEFFAEWSGAYVHVSDESHRRRRLDYEDTDDFATWNEGAVPYDIFVREGFVSTRGSTTVDCGICDCLNIGINNVAPHIRGQRHSSMRVHYLRWFEDRLKAREGLERPSESQQVQKETAAIIGNTRETGAKMGNEREVGAKMGNEKEIGVKMVNEREVRAKLGNDREMGSNPETEREVAANMGNEEEIGVKMGNEREMRAKLGNEREMGSNPGTEREVAPKLGNCDKRESENALQYFGNEVPCVYVARLSPNDFSCVICDLRFTNRDSVVSHIGGNGHAISLRRFGCDEIVLVKRDTYEYHCGSCDCPVLGVKNVRQHVRGNRHANSLALNSAGVSLAPTNENFVPAREKWSGVECSASLSDSHFERLSDGEFYCRMCDVVENTKADVDVHIAGEDHSFGLQQLKENISFREGNKYYCRSCDCSIPGMDNVYGHIMGNRHARSLGYWETGSNETSAESRTFKPAERLVESFYPVDLASFPKNHVEILNGSDSLCRLCDVTIKGVPNVHQHLTGERHSFWVQQLSENITFTGCSNYYHCKICDCSPPGIENVYRHLRSNRHAQSMSDLENRGQPTTSNEISTELASLVESSSSSNIGSLPKNHVEKINSSDSLCRLCDVIIKGVPNVHQHVTGERHSFWAQQLAENITSKGGKNYYCKICDCSPPGLENVYRHLRSNRHAQSMSDLESRAQPTTSKETTAELETSKTAENIVENSSPLSVASLPKNHVEKVNSSDSHCKLCDVIIKGVTNVEQHVTGERHSFWAQQLSENITFKSGNNYHCKCCDCTIPGLDNVYGHITGNRHAESLNDLEYRKRKTEKEKLEKSKAEIPGQSTSGAKSSALSSLSLPSDASFPKDHLQSRGNAEFHCRLCDEAKLRESNVQQHLTNPTHLSNAQRLSRNISFKGGNRYQCKSCACVIPGVENVYRHVNGARHAKLAHDLEKREREKSRSSTSEKPEKTEQTAKTETPKIPGGDASPNHDHIVKLTDAISCCRICDRENFEANAVEIHVAGTRHAAALQQFADEILPAGHEKYQCKRCNWTIYGIENVYAHLHANKHQSLTRKSAEAREPEIARIPEGSESQAGEIPSGTIGNPPKLVFPSDDVLQNIPGNLCGVRLPNTGEPHSHLAIHVGENFPASGETADVGENKNDSGSQPERDNRNDNAKSQSTIECRELEEAKLHNDDENELTASSKSSPMDGTTTVETVDVNETKDNSGLEPDREIQNNIAESQSTTETEIRGSKETKLADDDDTAASMKNPVTDKTENGDFAISNSVRENHAESAESADEKRRSPCKSSSQQRIVQLLNFDDDFIHDMRDKLRDTELGFRLSSVAKSGDIYCLVCRKNVASTADVYLAHLSSVDHCEYLEGMEKDHALFELVTGQFSEYDLVRQYMEEITEDRVRCHACGRDIENVDGLLKNHINEKSHERSCRKMHLKAKKNFETVESHLRCDWYEIHDYWCVPCSEHFKTELGFTRHLRSTGHAIVKRKSKNAERGFVYDFCASCRLLWFGYRATRAKHCDGLAHKWATSRANRGSQDLPKTLESHLVAIEQYVDDAARHRDALTSGQRDKEETLVRDLEMAVKAKFHGAKAHAFGSRASGLRIGDSDLEIFLDCDNMYDGRESLESKILYLMTSVHECLSKHPQSWSVDTILTSSRSSILKALHIPTGLTCELSFENGLAVEDSKLIKYYADIFPPYRKLMLFLNQWLVLCDLAGPQGISHQALHWYTIFYLQKDSTVPSVASLIAIKNVSHRIAGWEVGVSYDFKNKKLSSGTLSVKELVTRFFAFYAKFDHRYDVACPLLGREIEKRAFADPSSLPKEMSLYVDYTENSTNPRPFRIDSVMCIQDPLNLQRNLTESVSKAQLSRFRACCIKSMNLLSS